jgi:hypothetical protein
MDYLEWVKALEPHALEWLKASGIPALAAAIAFASWRSTRSSNQWQVRIARQKLKHDLYDRRFAVYMAFHELMVAVAEKSDVDAELRKANAARAHSPFLLDPDVTQYLAGLHTEAFRINAMNKLVGDPSMGDPVELAQMGARQGSDKLTFANRIPELVKKFESLKLNDFSE